MGVHASSIHQISDSTCVNMYIHICIHVPIYMYIHTHTGIDLYIHELYVYIYIHTYIPINTSISTIFIQIHTHIRNHLKISSAVTLYTKLSRELTFENIYLANPPPYSETSLSSQPPLTSARTQIDTYVRVSPSLPSPPTPPLPPTLSFWKVALFEGLFF